MEEPRKVVLHHTCRPVAYDTTLEHLMPGERYFSTDPDQEKPVHFREMPTKKECSCRKKVTRARAMELVDKGVAGYIFRLKKIKSGRPPKVECDPTQIISLPRRSKTPRIDLITSADVERAYIDGLDKFIEYIEDVQTMTLMFRLEMFRSWIPDPQEGRVLFPFGKDQRTGGNRC